MCNPLKNLKPPKKCQRKKFNQTPYPPPPPLHESILTTTATSKSLELNLIPFQKDINPSRNNLNLTLPEKILTSPPPLPTQILNPPLLKNLNSL